ncbi:hypothetical protein GCM10007384_34630 [Aquimarina muelleri]|uniref:VOC domain-containing protein n=2 Tax=Aquimarina muelleri TaxID=279356 RepID=A0A918N4M6_9FLAO|nr:hypothetical protein GCM10007384_34630 [Aquimarina muelleri]
MDGIEMGWFPNKNEQGTATGTLIYAGENYGSSKDGVLIYFSCDEISRVEDAGGKIVSAKKQISENHGYMAHFMDSEVNRIALHSLK